MRKYGRGQARKVRKKKPRTLEDRFLHPLGNALLAPVKRKDLPGQKKLFGGF